MNAALNRILKTSPSQHWEHTGLFFGLVACSSIGAQVVREWSSSEPSTLSWFFLVGFTSVYLFWFFYGIRFRHLGIWLPNIFAVLLQLLLAGLVILKGQG